MTCFEQLKGHLAQVAISRHTKAFGYNHPDTLKRAASLLLEQPDLYAWLKSGYFDFQYGATGFFLKACEVFDLPMDACQKELEEARKKLRLIYNDQEPYIEALLDEATQENFKRVHGFFANMALHSWCRTLFSREHVLSLNQPALIHLISDTIKEHQERGHPPIMGPNGQILGYVYHHIDGSIMHFDPEGNRLD